MPREMLPGEWMELKTALGKVRIYQDDTVYPDGLISGVHIISVNTGTGYEEVYRYLRFEDAAPAYLDLCFQFQRASVADLEDREVSEFPADHYDNFWETALINQRILKEHQNA